MYKIEAKNIDGSPLSIRFSGNLSQAMTKATDLMEARGFKFLIPGGTELEELSEELRSIRETDK
jgi:hypothetical protein